MIDFINGIVEEIGSDHITICTNGIGFKVFTPNPYVFKENDESKVYLYMVLKQKKKENYF